MKKRNLIIIIAFLILISGVLVYFFSKTDTTNYAIQNKNSQDLSSKKTISEKTGTEIKKNKTSQVKNLPIEKILNVPFTSQAPFANWDFDHNEACEEASVFMISEFLKGNKINKLDSNYANIEIGKLIELIKKTYGTHIDLTASQTNEILLKKYYNINAEVVSLNQKVLMQNIASGKPVIIPFAGRELHNPNFKTPGPIYHMLVVKGYKNNGKTIVTNDPGTRNGESFEYSWKTNYGAAHD
jgi:hypothetical protein